MGIFGIFLQKCLESSTFHDTFVKIAEFEWLPGRQKVLINFEKNLLLSNHEGGGGGVKLLNRINDITISLYMNYIFSQLDEKCGCHGSIKFPLNYNEEI